MATEDTAADQGDGDQYLSVLASDGSQLTRPIAALGSRSYAFLIDWHLRVLLVLAWLAMLALLADGDRLVGFFERLDDGDAWWTLYWIWLPPILIYLLYHPVLEVLMGGRTPGKRLAKLTLVTLDGRPPGTAALIIRNVFRLVDSLPSLYMVGCATCMLTKHRVRIGDLAAGLVLVHQTEVERGDVEQSKRLVAEGGLGAAESELVLDLIKRWRGLERDRRISLATRLLERLGVTVPDETKRGRLDRALKAKLEKIARDGLPHAEASSPPDPTKAAFAHWLEGRFDRWKALDAELEGQRDDRRQQSAGVFSLLAGYRALTRDYALAATVLPGSRISRYLESRLMQAQQAIERAPG